MWPFKSWFCIPRPFKLSKTEGKKVDIIKRVAYKICYKIGFVRDKIPQKGGNAVIAKKFNEFVQKNFWRIEYFLILEYSYFYLCHVHFLHVYLNILVTYTHNTHIIYYIILAYYIIKYTTKRERNIFETEWGSQRYEHITSQIDKQQYNSALFLDCSKALDCVGHDLIPKKLRMLGVSGVANKWFESYLNGRYQVVGLQHTTDNTRHQKSNSLPITRGVPLRSSPLPGFIYLVDQLFSWPYPLQHVSCISMAQPFQSLITQQ